MDDLKFMERIHREAVAFPGVFLDEENLSELFTFEVEVRNLHDRPLEAAFEWLTEGTDWVV